MLRDKISFASLALFLAVVLPSTADAQIDHRVNQGNAGMAGRANDANPSVGGLGLNQPVSRFDPGGYSNAVISGNVTGLARFQGFSPIPQANQFRGSLPSTALSSFQAQSIGVSDVTANRTYAPARYYDIESTISDVGFIRSGLNAPGSSAIASPNIVPPSVTTSPPPAGLRNVPLTTDLRVDQLSNRSMLGLIRQEQVAPGAGQLIGPTISEWRYQSAAESSIFGMPQMDPLQQLRAREGSRPNLRPGEKESGQPFEPEDARGVPGAGGLGPATTPEPKRAGDLAEDFGVRHKSLLEEPSRVPAVDQRGPVRKERIEGGKPPANLGEDRFADLYRAIQTAQQMGVKRLGFEAGEGAALAPTAPGVARIGAPPATGEPAPTAPTRRAILRRPASDALADLATAATWANELIEDPVTSFAGRYQNQLNQYMESGEAALRKGEYYRAAGLFDVAHAVDLQNPLSLLHRGHALLAAGDYMSAAASLQQGIARFPQIAAFRIDLPALAGSVYDVRRADLEMKLANSDQYELRFLLGYMELYSGLPEEGLRDLQQAANAAPPDSIIALFADLVTNRRELPRIAQPQRATGLD